MKSQRVSARRSSQEKDWMDTKAQGSIKNETIQEDKYATAKRERQEHADADHAAALDIQYQAELARWKALSWWKRLKIKKPEPPTRI